MRSLLSSAKFANVTAMLALVVATAGTSYAAVSLPKNSVGTPQLKKNAVVSKKVKDGSLLAKDFAAGQLPKGEQGPAGQPGQKGADGTALAFANVAADGTVNLALSKGITQANVTRPAVSAGRYCFTGMSVVPRNAVVTLDASTANPDVFGSFVEIGPAFGCDPATQVSVFTTKGSGSTFTDLAFFVLFN